MENNFGPSFLIMDLLKVNVLYLFTTYKDKMVHYKYKYDLFSIDYKGNKNYDIGY